MDVIGVTSESMQPFKVDTFRRSCPTDVVLLRFLITEVFELQLQWLRIKVTDDIAGQ
jgi:hypothetical protein